MAEQNKIAIQTAFLWQNVRQLVHIEAFGLRTAVATVLPLIAGQLLGFPVIGLMVGLGGLYVSVADKEGAKLNTLLWATIGTAVAAFLGTVVGGNPWLSIILMALWAFIGGMFTALGVIPGHIGFVTTLVFASTLGIAGNLDAGVQRMIEFAVGGLWATLLTLLLWRYEGRHPGTTLAVRRRPIPFMAHWRRHRRSIRRELNSSSIILHHALRLAFISALAVALYKLFHLAHGSWLTITVLVIVKPDYSSTRQRAVERVVGTLLGAVVALLTAALVKHIIIADVALLCLSILAYSNQRHNYGLFVVYLTPFVLLLLTIAAPGDAKLAPTRVVDTLIGGGLALAMAYLLRPRVIGPT